MDIGKSHVKMQMWREDGHVAMEAETGGTYLEAEASVSPELSEGAQPAGTPTPDLQIQNCEATTFCCVKPPGLWNFVTAA